MIRVKKALSIAPVYVLGLSVLLSVSATAQPADQWAALSGGSDGSISVSTSRLDMLQRNLPALQRNVSLQLEGASLQHAIDHIAGQADLRVSYGSQVKDTDRIIDVTLENVSALAALQEVLRDTGLALEIARSGHIVIVDRPITRREDAPQTGSIAGRVTDAENGDPLPGVNVVISNTTNGSATDPDGRYTISGLDSGIYNVTASFIGYTTQIIEDVQVADDQVTVLDIQMSPSAVDMDEVVVVGYGTVQRRDLTGSVASVSSQNIENLPVTTFDQALQGQVAGVRAQQTSGTPGGGINLQIRGVGSIGAGNQPLYVIDGMPVEQEYSKEVNPLAGINPQDIQSIQILKDASAAAIYGSRGSNGVVLIQTKQGRSGRPTVSVNTYMGMQEVQRKIPMMDPVLLFEHFIDARDNAYLYAAWQKGIQASKDDPNEVRIEVGGGDYSDNHLVPDFYRDIVANPQNYKFYDWQDIIFKQSPMYSTTVSASGGSEAARYYLSGSYMNQEGIVVGSGFQRYSFRLNSDANLSNRVRVGLSFTPAYSEYQMSDNEGAPWGASNGTVIGNALAIFPVVPPTCPEVNSNPAEELACPMESQVYGDMKTWSLGTHGHRNPLAVATEVTDVLEQFRVLGNTYLELDLADGLLFRSSLGVDYNNQQQDIFRPAIVERFLSGPSNGSAVSDKTLNVLNENTLTFTKTFAGRHSLNMVGGFTVQRNQWERVQVNAGQFPNDLVKTMNAGVVNGGGSWISEWGLLSYLARVNYDYDDRYLFTASFRSDGSSRFGEDNKWGLFPSMSVAWRLSNESFMQGISTISDLKLRASYGETGNFSIPDYAHIARLAEANYVFGEGQGSLVNGLRPSSLSNSDLGWEKTRSLNTGIDIGLFNDRFYFSAEYYNSNTTDLLLNVPIPEVIGFSNALTNIGEVKNSGWEFAVATKYTAGDLTWSSDLNLSWNRNEVLALGPAGDPIYAGNNITMIGEPIGSFFGYVHDGIFRTDAEAEAYPVEYPSGTAPRGGDVRFKDINGDGRLTADDRTVLGNNEPGFIYGWTNNFYWKNLDLRLVLQGTHDYTVWNAQDYSIYNRGQFNQFKFVENAWRSPENPGDGRMWRAFRDGFLMNQSPSNFYMFDASFLKISNITLGYRIPQRWVNNTYLNNARIYFSVQNAFTFTDYEWGYDPEVSFHGDNPLQPGIDFGGYPVPRIYTLGVTLGF